MRNTDLFRAAAELADYEEPDPPHPNTRPRCGRGHFLGRPIISRGWTEYWLDNDPGPHYKMAGHGDKWDEYEIFCPTCNSWGEFGK